MLKELFPLRTCFRILQIQACIIPGPGLTDVLLGGNERVQNLSGQCKSAEAEAIRQSSRETSGAVWDRKLDELCREAEALQQKFASLQASKAHEQQHLKQLEFDAALSAISAAAESLRTAAAATLTEPASKPAAPLQRQLTESDQSNLEHIEEGIRWPSEYGSQQMQKDTILGADTQNWKQTHPGPRWVFCNSDLGGATAALLSLISMVFGLRRSL